MTLTLAELSQKTKQISEQLSVNETFGKLRYEHENHQTWLKHWNPSDQQLIVISENKLLSKLFGYQFRVIGSEIYEEKLQVWAQISSFLISDDQLDYNQKAEFIRLFESIEPHFLKLLVRVSSEGVMPHSELAVSGPEDFDSDKYKNYLAYTQCAVNGLLHTGNDSNGPTIILTTRGQKFIEFLGLELKDLNKK